MTLSSSAVAPQPPCVRLCLGVTGHRQSHLSYLQAGDRIEAAAHEVLDTITAAIAAEPPSFGPRSIGATRLHSMLADGADQIFAREALRRDWELVAPLPLGRNLNCAVNAAPPTTEDARSLVAGGAPADPATAARAQAITALYGQARLFELAEADDAIASAFLSTLDSSGDRHTHQDFTADLAMRVAMAAQIVVEQSDIIIAVWDGLRASHVGGTGHTVARALALGAPVIWIDPAEPEGWRVLRAPEALATLSQSRQEDREDQVGSLVRTALRSSAAKSAHGPRTGKPGAAALEPRYWRVRSNPVWHIYRRVEALFGAEKGENPWRALRQTYEAPDAVANGGGAGLLRAAAELPGGDPEFAPELERRVLARFVWADGISAHLSDAYRGGMTINFLLSSLAIVGGLAYLPLDASTSKWAFAAFELVLLTIILSITFFGRARRWHERWFETRRVAEYLRHAPLSLALGAARAPGRWPKGAQTSWPEWYALQAVRELGLPRVAVTSAYLRSALAHLLDAHVTAQRDYHRAKSRRLTRVHHNLDALSEWLFRLAVASVAIYLGLQVAVWSKVFDATTLKELSKSFTFLGVALPTFGASAAGIRYFGDFERFAAISEVTAQKLDNLHARISLLLQSPGAIHYGVAAEIAHAADEIVVSEVENWQAVFGGKQITVPV